MSPRTDHRNLHIHQRVHAAMGQSGLFYGCYPRAVAYGEPCFVGSVSY